MPSRLLDVVDLGWDAVELGPIRTTASGDVRLTTGLPNFRQAILRRGITEPGAMGHRPTYGMGFLGQVETQKRPRDLAAQANRARANALEDPRTQDAECLISETDTGYDADLRVKIRGEDEIESVTIPMG